MSILHFFFCKKKFYCKSQSAIAIDNFLNSRAEGGGGSDPQPPPPPPPPPPLNPPLEFLVPNQSNSLALEALFTGLSKSNFA